MPVYKTPTVRDEDDVLVPAHADEHSADAAHYRYHYRGGYCYIASTVEIGTYEEYAEDEDSDVEKVADADGTDEYPAPEEE